MAADPSIKRSPRVKFFAFAVAGVGALFSFANSLSHNKVPVSAFQSFGPAFFAADTVASSLGASFLAIQQERLRVQLGLPPSGNEVREVASAELEAAAFAMMAREPIDGLGATIASFAAIEEGRPEAADLLLDRATQLSRRNRMALYWLMQRSLLDGEFKTAINHLDVMMRTIGAPPADLLKQVAVLGQVPEGREALAELVRRDPNWLISLFEVMLTSSPDARSVADLLLENTKELKDTPRWRAFYQPLVARLATEGDAERLLALYERIPRTRLQTLREVALDPLTTSNDLAPVAWQYFDESGVGGAVLADSSGDAFILNIYAGAGRSGRAATKVFAPMDRGSLSIRSSAREIVRGADARVTANCSTREDVPIESANLFENAGRTVSVDLPKACPLVRVDVTIAASQFDDADLDLVDISAN